VYNCAFKGKGGICNGDLSINILCFDRRAQFRFVPHKPQSGKRSEVAAKSSRGPGSENTGGAVFDLPSWSA
jgi:hypothetical protein